MFLLTLLFNSCCQNVLISESMTVPGHIVFVDTNSRKVCCIEESGKKLSKEFDLGNLKHPSDIAINANHYFICDYKVIIIGKKELYDRYNIDSEIQFC